LGVPQSTSEAIAWYQKSSALGDAMADDALRALQTGH
jgi:TPR repeat protein